MAHITSVTTPRRVAGVGGLLELLDAARLEHAGEPLDLLGHSLQCAARLERTAPDDVELQIAGLVHDLGAVLDPFRPDRHARTGADAVRGVLGDRIADLVAGHDDAKRFLVTTDAGYRRRLSDHSRATLRLQGGLMDPDERARFLAHPDADALVLLRWADDVAKVPGAPVPGIDHWTLALYAVAAAARS